MNYIQHNTGGLSLLEKKVKDLQIYTSASTEFDNENVKPAPTHRAYLQETLHL